MCGAAIAMLISMQKAALGMRRQCPAIGAVSAHRVPSVNVAFHASGFRRCVWLSCGPNARPLVVLGPAGAISRRSAEMAATEAESADSPGS